VQKFSRNRGRHRPLDAGDPSFAAQKIVRTSRAMTMNDLAARFTLNILEFPFASLVEVSFPT
jgi:hypothetical protein